MDDCHFSYITKLKKLQWEWDLILLVVIGSTRACFQEVTGVPHSWYKLQMDIDISKVESTCEYTTK